MSAQHTPGLLRVSINGRLCEVHRSRVDASVTFVRVATRSKGDGNGWRHIDIAGPLARAAIAKATGSTP